MVEAPITLEPKREHCVIGVGDFGVSNSADATLSTYALGSCIAIIAYDPANLIAGLLHFMLPDSSKFPDRAIMHPSIFADTGMQLLMWKMKENSADRVALKIFLAGGASELSGDAMFSLGARNIEAIHNILEAEGLEVEEEDLGGVTNRNLRFEIGSGLLEVKTTVSKQICLK